MAVAGFLLTLISLIVNGFLALLGVSFATPEKSFDNFLIIMGVWTAVGGGLVINAASVALSVKSILRRQRLPLAFISVLLAVMQIVVQIPLAIIFFLALMN